MKSLYWLKLQDKQCSLYRELKIGPGILRSHWSKIEDEAGVYPSSCQLSHYSGLLAELYMGPLTVVPN